MFTISLKITKRQIIAAGASFVLAFAGGIWARAAFTQLRGTPAQSSHVVKINKAAGKTAEQRIELLGAFGWEVQPEEAEIVEVLIPKEFDDVLEEYNAIQKAQGCDLKKYCGKRCKRYSYTVLNYPGQTENIQANILTYKDKIIGGDICSLELDGFMYGLAGNPGTGNDAASGGQEGNNPSSSTPSGEAGNGNTKAKN